jgi:uncharacterized protein YjbI with pentapeptide repeats
MANPEHLAKLKEGVEAWNQWRRDFPDVRPFLNGADLRGVDFRVPDPVSRDHPGSGKFLGNLLRQINYAPSEVGVNFEDVELNDARFNEANLVRANLTRAKLQRTKFTGAILREAEIFDSNLSEATLEDADLRKARLVKVSLRGANLRGANLSGAHLSSVDLTDASLTWADLRNVTAHESTFVNADLSYADLTKASLAWSKLGGANLSQAKMVFTDLFEADIAGCRIFGISAWGVKLGGTKQSNLIITREDEATVTVDNLEIAQFIYLLRNNERIRHAIDTITSKVVLILGRFTEERKPVLDAIRVELRRRDYLPVLFDFQKPDNKDLTGTVTTLANMARFIIADLTDSSSVPHELAMVVPGTVVPVQTILLNGQREYAMFADLKRRHHWVLEPYQYESEQSLMEHLVDGVIAPAEAKVEELRDRQ